MQYRSPPAVGPSSKTWPRWPPHRRHRTSVRVIKNVRSRCSVTASATAGSEKLGQPVPESNLVSDPNSAAPQPAQWYMPSSWQSQYSPVKARSVPALRSTSNWAGVSCARHSSSALATGGSMVLVVRLNMFLQSLGSACRFVAVTMLAGRRQHRVMGDSEWVKVDPGGLEVDRIT